MRIALLLLLPTGLAAQTADEIMARVAENQTRSETARASFVYHENLLVRLKRSNGKLAREELRDYTVTPTPEGVTRELVQVKGKYGLNGKEFEFTESGFHHQGTDIDADVVRGIADHFGKSEGHGKDGIVGDLFPLTTEGQRGYAFHLDGRDKYNGMDVFRVTFKPGEKKDPRFWAGEALIDTSEYQPVLVTMHMARGFPAAAKILAGTDLTQTGFKVTYRKFAEGLWFPVSYGGEMRLRAAFFYARTIAIGAINSDFRHTDVHTEIAFEEQTAEPK